MVKRTIAKARRVRLTLAPVRLFLVSTILTCSFMVSVLFGARIPALSRSLALWNIEVDPPSITSNWKADLRTLAAAGRWLFAPDTPPKHVPIDDLPAEPQVPAISGTNSHPFSPTA